MSYYNMKIDGLNRVKDILSIKLILKEGKRVKTKVESVVLNCKDNGNTVTIKIDEVGDLWSLPIYLHRNYLMYMDNIFTSNGDKLTSLEAFNMLFVSAFDSSSNEDIDYPFNADVIFLLDDNIKEDSIDFYRDFLVDKLENSKESVTKSRYFDSECLIRYFYKMIIKPTINSRELFNTKNIIENHKELYEAINRVCTDKVKIFSCNLLLLELLYIKFNLREIPNTDIVVKQICQYCNIKDPIMTIVKSENTVLYHYLDPSLFDCEDDYKNACNTIISLFENKKVKAKNIMSVVTSYNSHDYNYELLVKALYYTDLYNSIGNFYLPTCRREFVFNGILEIFNKEKIGVRFIKKISKFSDQEFNRLLYKYMIDNIEKYENINKVYKKILLNDSL